MERPVLELLNIRITLEHPLFEMEDEEEEQFKMEIKTV
jgi:hypothetical protein